MTHRQRVFLYITQGDKLLVFDQVDFPEAGTQIPGGSIKPDEAPEAAARREAYEETGLHSFSSQVLLAQEQLDLTPYGRPETLDAWFFHLSSNQETPRRWRHLESEPGDGAAPIRFECYWVALHPNLPLAGADGRHLDKVTNQPSHDKS
ncbi:MAG: NUDIX domain-containing protein [Verrucomicrobiota bacterium]